MKYLGADWIKSNFEVPMSPLGEDVANFLGDVFFGIYHLNTTSLRKVDWGRELFISVVVDKPLATVDGDALTRIVVLAHDRMLRVDIRAVAPGYNKFVFHKRINRVGTLWSRCPELDDHVSSIRGHYADE